MAYHFESIHDCVEGSYQHYMFAVYTRLLSNYWHCDDTKVKCHYCVFLTDYGFCGSLAPCEELLHDFAICD